MNKHLDLPARALALTVSLATAVTLAAPAHADPIDDSFLAALNNGGINYSDPANTVALGESVCPMLVEPGKSFASVYSRVANNGIPPEMAAFFTGIAISMYCPQMMSSVGNGTFLNWLQVPGLTR
ncbi:DUF732 domain-containing protein [Mycobacterium sp.]|uniref:DUF732 domain-containing protein n=1 Tax=Mycobacterium sp. TaxID=1785 RepID=UPI002DB35002|nr:DUF732 domain-containing protein [Mycobacterium sp.]